MNTQTQVGWNELCRVTKPFGISNYKGGNGGKAKGFLADLRAKPLKIANTFSKESAIGLRTEMLGRHFVTFNVQMSLEWIGP